MGWYQKLDMETGEELEGKYRAAETETSEFWHDILNHPKFSKFVQDKYALGEGLLTGIELADKLEMEADE